VIVELTVAPRRPYSLALTAARYARFPEVVDSFDGAAYRRLLFAGRRRALLTVTQQGAPSRAVLRATLDGDADAPAVVALARRVVGVALGADVDVRAFYRAHREDPVVGAAIRDFAGLRPAGVPSLYEAALTAILAQQVNLRFAYDIRRELSLAFGRRARLGGAVRVAFPEPAALAAPPPRELRRFRLSRSKAAAIHALSTAFADGAIREEELAALDDEAAIERLTALHGVGRWTAEIALMRGLGRMDIFPAGDLGVIKYVARGLLNRTANAKEAEMRAFAERWRPHRTLALVYAYAELTRRRESSSPPTPRARRRTRGSARSRAR
jgi:DNA-3-methyladenine glycosylase II